MARILIVEDKNEEMEKAILTGKELGHEITAINPTEGKGTWIEFVPDVDGVLTDLMFSPCGTRGKGVPPAGLLVVIHAALNGKPVVVCTDECSRDEKWGHHGEAVGWIWGGYLGKFRFNEKPFGFVGDKNWERAFELLKKRMEVVD